MRDKSVRESRKSDYQLLVYVPFKLSLILSKKHKVAPERRKNVWVQLKSNNNLLTMSHITRRALWPRALTAIQFIPFPGHPPSPISHWYMGHVGIQWAAREAGEALADQDVNEWRGLVSICYARQSVGEQLNIYSIGALAPCIVLTVTLLCYFRTSSL